MNKYSLKYLLWLGLFTILLLSNLSKSVYSQITWSHAYGSSGYEDAYSILQTSDGGYLIASIIQPGSTYDVWLIKLDFSGNILWQNTYGSIGRQETANKIEQTADGGHIIGGNTSNVLGGADILVIKLNSAGGIVWQNAYGASELDRLESIQPTSDGGYIFAGYTDSFSFLPEVFFVLT